MSEPTSVVFLGAKRIGAECLEWLLAAQHTLDVRVVGVLTNARGDGVRAAAQSGGVPDLGELDALLTHPPVDFLVSVQYHQILKPAHISRARRLAVNLHMAPLPEYRGCNQFSFAIVDDAAEFGTTLHVLEPGVDSGDILAERRFPVPRGCFVDELFDLTYAESVALFKAEMPAVFSGVVVRTPQASFAGVRQSGYHRRSDIEDLKRLDLSWPADRLERHIRATLMPGFPPAWCEVAGRHIKFVLAPVPSND